VSSRRGLLGRLRAARDLALRRQAARLEEATARFAAMSDADLADVLPEAARQLGADQALRLCRARLERRRPFAQVRDVIQRCLVCVADRVKFEVRELCWRLDGLASETRGRIVIGLCALIVALAISKSVRKYVGLALEQVWRQ
jgi:hypothetical protein